MLVAQGRLRTPPGEDFAAAQGSLVVAGQARSIAAVDALRQIDDWGAEHAAAAVVRPGEVVARHGDEGHVFRWASVTKPVTALAVLVAAEEGTVDLDEPAGPPGSTVRHLLAHASGLPFTGDAPIARPGERRIYSNTGFEVAAEHLAERAEMPFADYLAGGRARAARDGRRAARVARGRPVRHARRRDPARARAARAEPGRSRDARRGDGGRVPRPAGRPARLRPLRPERLGARLRAQGREGAALDGLAATLRAPSATSAARGRSSGSIPTASWRWRA